MEQVLTVKIKIFPTQEVEKILEEMGKEYIDLINDLIAEMLVEKNPTRKTSKHVQANLPSVLKCQAIRDANGIFLKRIKKSNYKIIPVLKKPTCIWNNQNYTFDSGNIYVPIITDGKVKRVPIKAVFNDGAGRISTLLKNKLGTLRITKKSAKWIAQIAVKVVVDEKDNGKVLGVDLGLKVPAVAVTDGGKIRFFGNGRRNKYMKRKFQSCRKRLGQKKKLNAIRSLGDREQRWMKDQDHKISRGIVDFAKDNGISVIRIERLTNIRQTARLSRKNNKSLQRWSFYRLTVLIEYKANLEGMRVEYVDPAYTSQTCPKCSARNKIKDRIYRCKCGFCIHRDIVGAINICHAPVVDGKSQSA
ncbi:transposase [Planococcus sp. 11815]|uniref:RNA-guided endonuclease InsQ/TnpB family protein n=1 Tax=Planococcus sp. 11815 TaxID=2939413 RepID=UPI003DA42E17